MTTMTQQIGNINKDRNYFKRTKGNSGIERLSEIKNSHERLNTRFEMDIRNNLQL